MGPTPFIGGMGSGAAAGGAAAGGAATGLSALNPWLLGASVLAPMAFGQKQVAPAAPAYTPGQQINPFQSGLGVMQDAGLPMGGLLSALQAANQQQQPAAPEAGATAENLSPQPQTLFQPNGLVGSQSPVDQYGKDVSLADIDDGKLENKQGPFASFLGGLDKGLQSPSQLLGLGLLSQLTGQHPAAGLGGLLAMGLYNRNK